MASIPGSIPVTGFIGPTDSTDVYPVTDSLYGIDGLRNVADNTVRNAIPFERRRTGMIVGTQNDLKYWKLLPEGSPGWQYDDTDWDLAFDLSVGPIANSGNKKIINVSETITVNADYQYLIYGDLTVNGTLDNNGEVCIINGALILGPFGVFNNVGNLVLVTLEPGNKKYKTTFTTTANVPLTITHNLGTLDFVYQARVGNDDVVVDLVRLSTSQVSITTTAGISGSLTIMAY